MKTHSLITILCIISAFISAQEKPIVIYKFNAPSLDKQVYPNTDYGTTVSFMNGNALGGVIVNWSIQNGTINANGKSSKNTLSALPGTAVTIIWDDTPGFGKITGIATYSNQDDSKNFIIKMDGPTSAQYPILSLKGAKTNFTAVSNLFPLGSTQMKNVSVYPETEYSQIMEYDVVYGQRHRKAEQYEWTLPDGWRSAQNQMGTFITDKSAIDVYPNPVKGKEIKVRAANANRSSFSDVATVTFDRTLGYTSWPHSIDFGDTGQHTFSVEKINLPGVQYEWTAPQGWQINGGTNSLITANTSVKISVKKYDGKSGVEVRLRYNGETSEWYPCPYQGVISPYVTATSTEVPCFEPVTFRLVVPSGSYSKINWTGNGYILSGQGTDKITVVATEKGTLSMMAETTVDGYISPSHFNRSVTVKPDRIVLVGSETICNQSSSYSLQNLPTTATVQWKSSNGNFEFKNTSGKTTIVYPRQYNARADLSATISCYGKTLEKVISVRSCALELLGPGKLTCPGTFRINYLLHQATIQWDYPSYITSEIQKYDSIRISGSGSSHKFQLKATVKMNGVAINSISKSVNYLVLTGIESMELNSIRQYDSYTGKFYYLICAKFLPDEYPQSELQYYWQVLPVRSTKNPLKILIPEIKPCVTDGSGHIGIAPIYPVGPYSDFNSVRAIRKDTAVLMKRGNESTIIVLRTISVPQSVLETPEVLGYQVIDEATGKTLSGSTLPNEPILLPNDVRYAFVTMPDEECETTVICRIYPKCGSMVSMSYNIDNHRREVCYSVINPANNTLLLTRNKTESTSAHFSPESLKVTLYNDYGILKTVETDTSASSLQIDVSNVPEGNYYLNVQQNGIVTDRQIVLIKH